MAIKSIIIVKMQSWSLAINSILIVSMVVLPLLPFAVTLQDLLEVCKLDELYGRPRVIWLHPLAQSRL